ncbi:MAG TPA: hypothetical protein VKY44_02880 [Flavobacterium sp.]|nr:hypothetical protein [Flavobacterium sp.]
MTLDHINIIKVLSCSLDVDFETKTSKNLSQLIELSRNIESIKRRYSSILLPEINEENSVDAKLYFQARIEGYYELSSEEIQEYCDLNRINLKDKSTWLYSLSLIFLKSVNFNN